MKFSKPFVAVIVIIFSLNPLALHAATPSGTYSGTLQFKSAKPVGSAGICSPTTAPYFVTIENIATVDGKTFTGTAQGVPVTGRRVKQKKKNSERFVTLYKFDYEFSDVNFDYKYTAVFRKTTDTLAIVAFKGVTTYSGSKNGCAYRYRGKIDHVA